MPSLDLIGEEQKENIASYETGRIMKQKALPPPLNKSGETHEKPPSWNKSPRLTNSQYEYYDEEDDG